MHIFKQVTLLLRAYQVIEMNDAGGKGIFRVSLKTKDKRRKIKGESVKAKGERRKQDKGKKTFQGER